MRSTRYFLNEEVEHCSLSSTNGGYLLTVSRGETGTERVLSAVDLSGVLGACPEIVELTATSALEITCADEEIRRAVVRALRDVEPDEDADEDVWQAHSPVVADRFLAIDFNGEAETILRPRLLLIDDIDHRPLTATGATRVVPIVDGDPEPDDVLLDVTWSVDISMSSSYGHDLLALVGDDTLLSYSSGDLPDASVKHVEPGDLPQEIASWLGDHLYGPAFLLRAVGTPSLTSSEQAELWAGEAIHQSISSGLDEGTSVQVVDALCTEAGYAGMRDALLHPDSDSGRSIYAELRALLDGGMHSLDFLPKYI